jgi:hypothetical protein
MVTFRGWVYDSNSNNPVENATITIPRLRIFRFANQNGYFEFDNVPTGEYNFVVVYRYYRQPFKFSFNLTSETELIIYMTHDYGEVWHNGVMVIG